MLYELLVGDTIFDFEDCDKVDIEKDRFSLYFEEAQVIYYYRYIVNLLLDRNEQAKKDLDEAINMVEKIKFVKKTHDIYGPYKNNEGELYANQLYEPKEINFVQERIYYEKINYYYLLRNNLDYKNYLKLFNNNLENHSDKKLNILNGFIMNTLKFNINNQKTSFY